MCIQKVDIYKINPNELKQLLNVAFSIGNLNKFPPDMIPVFTDLKKDLLNIPEIDLFIQNVKDYILQNYSTLIEKSSLTGEEKDALYFREVL